MLGFLKIEFAVGAATAAIGADIDRVGFRRRRASRGAANGINCWGLTGDGPDGRVDRVRWWPYGP